MYIIIDFFNPEITNILCKEDGSGEQLQFKTLAAGIKYARKNLHEGCYKVIQKGGY